jgi:RNA polymerase sigma-70 factor, ECF subfamily
MRPLSLTRQPSDAFLLTRVADGDVRAFEIIDHRYRRSALTLARRVCGQPSVAEEVVQEALLAVWRRASTYSEARGSASGWILTIVHHRAIDASRRQGRNQAIETALGDPEEQLAGSTLIEAEAERRERAGVVRAALTRLPAAQREAAVLTHFCGLTQAETATAVGRPLGTVKGRIRLGHARLRQELLAVGPAGS